MTEKELTMFNLNQRVRWYYKKKVCSLIKNPKLGFMIIKDENILETFDDLILHAMKLKLIKENETIVD